MSDIFETFLDVTEGIAVGVCILIIWTASTAIAGTMVWGLYSLFKWLTS